MESTNRSSQATTAPEPNQAERNCELGAPCASVKCDPRELPEEAGPGLDSRTAAVFAALDTTASDQVPTPGAECTTNLGARLGKISVTLKLRHFMVDAIARSFEKEVVEHCKVQESKLQT